mmetsp:Transcript_15512/g.15432  ORF Transcript_15512/g.15432 Transcript_15512/m.15432 type:complete len:128 (-) Transcript_15512:339-722(-)
MNLVMSWGGTLKTTMIEVDVKVSEAKADTTETHLLVSKLEKSKAPVGPSFLSSWGGGGGGGEDDSVTTMNSTIKVGSCFIDGVCYESGVTAEFFGLVCFVYNPTVSQTNWTIHDGNDWCHRSITLLC